MSDDPKTVYARVQEHLKAILATTAITGATLGLGSTCACDPMPTPFCETNPTTPRFLEGDYRIKASAVWAQGAGGALLVNVELTAYAGSTENKITFASDPALRLARLLAVSRSASKLTFSFVPEPGADAGTAGPDAGPSFDAGRISPDAGGEDAGPGDAGAVVGVEAIIQLDCSAKPEVLKIGFDVTSPAVGKKVAIVSLE